MHKRFTRPLYPIEALEPLLTRQGHPSYPRVVIADHSVMNRMLYANSVIY
jgi:hypothetical protein